MTNNEGNALCDRTPYEDFIKFLHEHRCYRQFIQHVLEYHLDLQNVRDALAYIKSIVHEYDDSLRFFLNSEDSFAWEEATEGYDYWNDIYDNLETHISEDYHVQNT